MSRTVRRKHYEVQERNHSWARQFRHKIGFYHEYDFVKHEDETHYWWETVYRELTKEEEWKRERWAHGESSTHNSRSPSPWYRQYREKYLRNHNKREIFKWVANEDHEPMCKENPDSCWWDWD
jgi:hypothetical protein